MRSFARPHPAPGVSPACDCLTGASVLTPPARTAAHPPASRPRAPPPAKPNSPWFAPCPVRSRRACRAPLRGPWRRGRRMAPREGDLHVHAVERKARRALVLERPGQPALHREMAAVAVASRPGELAAARILGAEGSARVLPKGTDRRRRDGGGTRRSA
jgi:hypothetical protein